MARKGKSALIIIDMLNDFVLKGAPLYVPETQKIIPALKKRISSARRKKEPVVFVNDAHAKKDVEFERFGWPAHGVKGTKGAEVVKDLAPRPGDKVIEKTTYSCFYRTSLDRTLKDLGADTLHLAGCVTNICIFYAAYDAVLRGYDVRVDERIVAGLDRKSHVFALEQMQSVLGVDVIRR
ncbi:MAG: isochorismatase family protein [Deltaproteobacteria bacterium]|nr:isochorismatase family protein [Deltaproteobacteria bacterium]NIS78343.1 isochorismatase family protein [Deltaproteobacteria bacterium]